MTPGLKLTTILYAGGLAVVSAAMLSLLPALRVTRARVQPHLANLGTGGATLRFGRVWTGAMIAQVALTAIGIPVAMESVSQAMRKLQIRAAVSKSRVSRRAHRCGPAVRGGDHAGVRGAAGADVRGARAAHRAGTRRGRGHVRRPRAGGIAVEITDAQTSRSSSGAGPAFDDWLRTSAVGPGFFEAFDRPIVAGRGFHGGDFSPAARTVIVNEAFVRGFRRSGGSGSPIGARLRYSSDRVRRELDASADGPWFEIVGVVRDLGLDPDDEGDEGAYVFHAASAGTVSPLVMSVRVRGNPATLAARLPVIAADCRCRIVSSRTRGRWTNGSGSGI